MSELKDRLKYAREQAGLSMSELDRRIGYKDGGFTTRIESGKKKQPSSEKLALIAQVLNVSVEWLVGVSDDKRPTGVRATEATFVEIDDEDPYPSRVPVVVLARERGVDAGAIKMLQAERLAEGDPGSEYWQDRLVYFMRAARKLDMAMASLKGETGEEPVGEIDPMGLTPQLPTSHR